MDCASLSDSCSPAKLSLFASLAASIQIRCPYERLSACAHATLGPSFSFRRHLARDDVNHSRKQFLVYYFSVPN